MKKKVIDFLQHLSHDIDDEEVAEKYLKETLPLIGLVVMYFNTLEKSLDSAICESISDRTDSRGLMILHGMNYSAKVDLFKRFCDDLHCSMHVVPPSYKDLIESLRETGRLRNLVVHADWNSTDHEGYTYIRMKISSSGMVQEYVQFSADSLENILEQIMNLNHQLSDYCEEKSNLISYGTCKISHHASTEAARLLPLSSFFSS